MAETVQVTITLSAGEHEAWPGFVAALERGEVPDTAMGDMIVDALRAASAAPGATFAAEIATLEADLARANELREAANAATLRAEAERNDYWRRAVGLRVRLRSTLAEAIDLAEEGWAYAGDYFRQKWRAAERIEGLRAVLEEKGD